MAIAFLILKGSGPPEKGKKQGLGGQSQKPRRPRPSTGSAQDIFLCCVFHANEVILLSDFLILERKGKELVTISAH